MSVLRLVLATAMAVSLPATVRADAESFPSYWQMPGPTLMHVPDDSDAMTLSLTCARAPFLQVETPVGEDVRSYTFGLSSGEARDAFPARIRKDEAGAFAEANVRRDAAVLQAFRKTGRLTLAPQIKLDATKPSERAVIARFFRRCR
jgi:hypothetical protein